MQLLIPILVLFYENDPDPELRPYRGPVSGELREQLIVGLSLSTMEIYKHFQPHRRRDAEHGSRGRRSSSRVGRNQMCPCGSGKKYKRCCGNETVQ
ncbi:MAG: SEC-C metal-binding domain-containing protein [Candidatus Korobacteraceae bacterium]